MNSNNVKDILLKVVISIIIFFRIIGYIFYVISIYQIFLEYLVIYLMSTYEMKWELFYEIIWNRIIGYRFILNAILWNRIRDYPKILYVWLNMKYLWIFKSISQMNSMMNSSISGIAWNNE